jgi:CxxC motif-containing protein (DUF1111 family)
MGRRIVVAAGAALFAACGAQPPAQETLHMSERAASPELVGTASGAPLRGLSPGELALFEQGRAVFTQEEDAADGLGPVFNEASCVACHRGADGAIGGSNGRLETRFGRVNADGSFDPMAAQGGSLLQDHGIGLTPDGAYTYPAESVPAGATVVAKRRTTNLFGLGLVDAVPDAEIRAIAAVQRIFTPAIAGRVAVVSDLAAGDKAVGKFGWKNGNPTLFQFSGDAYLNEMGITSAFFTGENCPQGDCGSLQYNPRPDLNDASGQDVQAFADFMTFLGPPPRGPTTLKTLRGETLFAAVGCDHCHVPTLVTGRNAVRALDEKAFHPYSDFLLHDMGALGDGIAQGAAGPRDMRTAPLWGLRSNPAFLHDGSAKTPEDAILAHDGQGARSRDRFAHLDRSQKAALLAFLDSL